MNSLPTKIPAFRSFLSVATIAGSAFSSVLSAAGTPVPASPDSVKISADVRLRYEAAEHGDAPTANALTLGTRLGFASSGHGNWSWMIEADDASVLDSVDSIQPDTLISSPHVGIRLGSFQTARESSDPRISQAWVSYCQRETTATLGRQRLVFDNARFIGNDDWRLAAQTFDALFVRNTTLPHTTATYAYVWRVNRSSPLPPFAEDLHTQPQPRPDYDSNSHLFNLCYHGCTAGSITAYAYLLDLKNAVWLGNASYGLMLTGQRKLSESVTLGYHAEYAVQTDHAIRSQYPFTLSDYETDYCRFELSIAAASNRLTVGTEITGSWHFIAPLGSQDNFLGWTGVMPFGQINGMRDNFLMLSLSLPHAIEFTGAFHDFRPVHDAITSPPVVSGETDKVSVGPFSVETGLPFFKFSTGHASELDLQLSHRFGTFVTGTVKFADFRGHTTLFHVRRFWLQAEFAY